MCYLCLLPIVTVCGSGKNGGVRQSFSEYPVLGLWKVGVAQKMCAYWENIVELNCKGPV